MNRNLAWTLVFAGLAVLGACKGAQQFAAVPEGMDTEEVPNQTIDVTAKQFEYTPGTIRVPRGTLVTLNLTALDTTHGFALDAFGIDVTLKKGETQTVKFFAGERGKYRFRCSHFCGMGHLGMKGELIVE